MRANVASYGKTNAIGTEDFAKFVKAFGSDPRGLSPRKDQGEEGRFRKFTRKEIAARDDNLDISWLKDTSGDVEDGLETPEEIAVAIELHLATALEEVRAVLEEMNGEAGISIPNEAAE